MSGGGSSLQPLQPKNRDMRACPRKGSRNRATRCDACRRYDSDMCKSVEAALLRASAESLTYFVPCMSAAPRRAAGAPASSGRSPVEHSLPQSPDGLASCLEPRGTSGSGSRSLMLDPLSLDVQLLDSMASTLTSIGTSLTTLTLGSGAANAAGTAVLTPSSYLTQTSGSTGACGS